MRKRIIEQPRHAASVPEGAWLDLEQFAQVEITSEQAGHLIEFALVPGTGPGWRAAHPGEQTIRLLFDKPLRLGKIHLLFQEDERARTQEFVLRWSADGGRTYREILRQQFTFSPLDTAREEEDYGVNLDGVTALELAIVPDISGGDARASLAQLRIA
jgi:hypothetical protein